MNWRLLFFELTCLAEVSYKFTNLKGEQPEYPFLTLKSDNQIYQFYDTEIKSDPIRIQNHTVYLIQSLYLHEKPIIKVNKNVKYVLNPFQDIHMLKNGNKILIGTYSHSFLKDGVFAQEYNNGDPCDFHPDRKNKAIVSFVPAATPLEIDFVIESEISKYQVLVKGEEITKIIDDIRSIGYNVVSEKQTEYL